MLHRFEQETGRLIIRMPREVDHHSVETLRRETDGLIARYPVRSILFDFQKLLFMNSSSSSFIFVLTSAKFLM